MEKKNKSKKWKIVEGEEKTGINRDEKWRMGRMEVDVKKGSGKKGGRWRREGREK